MNKYKNIGRIPLAGKGKKQNRNKIGLLTGGFSGLPFLSFFCI